MARKITIEQIELAQDDLETMKINYLRQNGWQQNCSIPGSYWVWQKEINGKLICTDDNFAITLQGEIDNDRQILK